MKVDEVLKIRTSNRPAHFAGFVAAVAEAAGALEDIETLYLGKDHAIREVTVELPDEAHRDRLLALLEGGGLEGITLLERIDRVFQLHDGGKVASRSTLKIDRVKVLRSVYTPGVARVCEAIRDTPQLARRYTNIGRTVGVFTNGTRVLGLGNIGPQASMPVMEGKAALYSELIGLAAVPVLVDTEDPGEFVETVTRVAPTFGGIHLEDIASPACFEIEQRLDDALAIPVMHDDRHGTAVAVLSGLLKACATLDIRLEDRVVAQIGLGAAGIGIAELLLAYGVETVLAVDKQPENAARVPRATPASFVEALREADIVVATTGVQGLIKPEHVRRGQIVFALSNPYPEIEPEVALEAGARFATDGSHVNNLLGFPGLFKGAMDTGRERIDHAMKIAAAEVIASRAPDDDLLPDALDRTLHRAVAAAVARAARR